MTGAMLFCDTLTMKDPHGFITEMPLFYAAFLILWSFFVWLTGLHRLVRVGVLRVLTVVLATRDIKHMGASVQGLTCPRDSYLSGVTVARLGSARLRAACQCGPAHLPASASLLNVMRNEHPKWQVDTAASAVSAAVRRQKGTFHPKGPAAASSHRGRRLLLLTLGPNGIQLIKKIALCPSQ